MANTRNATRRLLRELEQWQEDQRALEDEKQQQQQQQQRQRHGYSYGYSEADVDANSPNRGIERLGPVADGDLFRWSAVLNGEGVGGGYDAGRWLLRIDVPEAYPLQPPTVRFVTPCLHANVHASTGAVCLDLLAAAWTPALSLVAVLRAVRLLLANPGLDSPLNVDLAALLRDGDALGAARLVALWSEEYRYEGA